MIHHLDGGSARHVNATITDFIPILNVNKLSKKENKRRKDVFSH